MLATQEGEFGTELSVLVSVRLNGVAQMPLWIRVGIGFGFLGSGRVRVGFGSGSGSDSDLESGSGRVRVRTLCVIFFNSMI